MFFSEKVCASIRTKPRFSPPRQWGQGCEFTNAKAQPNSDPHTYIQRIQNKAKHYFFYTDPRTWVNRFLLFKKQKYVTINPLRHFSQTLANLFARNRKPLLPNPKPSTKLPTIKEFQSNMTMT
jgi:hypothetical protein